MSDVATWVKRAEALKPASQLFIDGKYVDAASGATFDSISSRDGRLNAKIAAGAVSYTHLTLPTNREV